MLFERLFVINISSICLSLWRSPYPHISETHWALQQNCSKWWWMLVDYAPVVNYIHHLIIIWIHIDMFDALYSRCRDGIWWNDKESNRSTTYHYMSCAYTTSAYTHILKHPKYSFSVKNHARAWWIWVHLRHLGQRSGCGFAPPPWVWRRCPRRFRCFGSPCRHRQLSGGSGQNPKLSCQGWGQNLSHQKGTVSKGVIARSGREFQGEWKALLWIDEINRASPT